MTPALSELDRTIVWTVTTSLDPGTKLGYEIHSHDLADYYLFPTSVAVGLSDYFDTYSRHIPGWATGYGFFGTGYNTTGIGTFGNVDVGPNGDFTITVSLTDYDNFNRISANTSIYLDVTRPAGPYGEPRDVLSTSSNVYITQETGMSITGGGNTNILPALTGYSEPAANGWLGTVGSVHNGRRVTEVTSVGTTTLTVDTGNLNQYPVVDGYGGGGTGSNVWLHAIAGGGGGGPGSDANSPGAGGGAGAYVWRQIGRDSEGVVDLVNSSNISVTVGAGGNVDYQSGTQATNTSITYETVASGNISVECWRGGATYMALNPHLYQDGGSGSGASWQDGSPGVGIGDEPADPAWFNQPDGVGTPSGHDGSDEYVPGGGTVRSAGAGGGAWWTGDDATANVGGDGGQGGIGSAYAQSNRGFTNASYQRRLNIPALPLANVYLGQGGGGGGLTPGVPIDGGGVPGNYQSGGTGGSASANATATVANTGSGGGGGRYSSGGNASLYYAGSAGSDGSFAISYKAAWRVFTLSL